MGTDYTLACRSCKRAAYIDRHGSALMNANTQGFILTEWVELGYSEPIHHRELLQVVNDKSLDECEDDYIESFGDRSIMPKLREFVASHERHGPIVLLSDGWSYSVDLCRAEGWERVDIWSGRVIEP